MSGETVILGGRYHLGRILGTWGMAEVFLADDTRLHRTVRVTADRQGKQTELVLEGVRLPSSGITPVTMFVPPRSTPTM